jgi:glycosyltransferase involved in cell wall biosynthesis
LHRSDVHPLWIDELQPGGTSLTAMLLAADVYVATSTRLGAASVGALAVDTGVHTIAESGDPCAELLSDGRGIVIATDDVDALSGALLSVVDERRRFADVAERHARRIEQLARSIERLYERALERPVALRVAG